MGEELEVILEALEEEEESIAVAEEIAEAQTEQEIIAREAVEKEEIQTFAQKFLSSAKSCGQWFSGGIKNMTMGNAISLGIAGLMLWQLLKSHASTAQKTGQLVKLSAAISGAEQTLSTNYQKTVVEPAQKMMNGPQWANLNDETKKTFQEHINLGAEGYWALYGPDIMKTLAMAPQYDASA
jgi:hypothetical protein